MLENTEEASSETREAMQGKCPEENSMSDEDGGILLGNLDWAEVGDLVCSIPTKIRENRSLLNNIPGSDASVWSNSPPLRALLQ